MVAVVMASPTLLPGWMAFGLTVMLGVMVVVWCLAAHRPKKLAQAAIVAVLLAGPAVATARADDDEFVMSNPCDRYPAWSPQWVMLGCWIPWP
jgi:hypothetical protein